MISRAEKLKLLEVWQSRYLALDAAWDKFSAITKADCDSELGNAAYRLFDEYTKTLAQLLGDESDWLQWWIYDNAMGSKNWSSEYPVTKGKRKFRARTLVHLLKIIETKC